jgi:hypothetical protein
MREKRASPGGSVSRRGERFRAPSLALIRV